MGEEDAISLDEMLAQLPAEQQQNVLRVKDYYGYWLAEATRNPIDSVALNTVTINLGVVIDTFLMKAKQQAQA